MTTLRRCNAPGCVAEIDDLTRSKKCKTHRGPSTHAAPKPTVKVFGPR